MLRASKMKSYREREPSGPALVLTSYKHSSSLISITSEILNSNVRIAIDLKSVRIKLGIVVCFLVEIMIPGSISRVH